MLFRLYTDDDPIPRLLIEEEDGSKINRRLIAHVIMSGGAQKHWRMSLSKKINRGHEESNYSRLILVDKLRNTVNQDDYISEHIGYMIRALDD